MQDKILTKENLLMIDLLVSPSCTSCRQAKAWLEEHELEYQEQNMVHNPLSKEAIKKILMLTDEGVSEIISYRSQAYQQLDVVMDDLSMSELLDLLIEQPSLIRRPIIMDDKRLQIGYNEDDIRCFLPREVRELELAEIHNQLNEDEEYRLYLTN